MTDKKILELKKQKQRKNPEFKHYDHQKRKRVGTRWRKPHGIHNKMRHGFNGKPVKVDIGYRTPAAVRFMDHTGLEPVLIYTLSEIAQVEPKVQGVILGKIGAKKRAVVLQACKEKGITVLNVKDVDGAIAAVGDALKSRKERKAEAEKKKTEKVKAEKKEKPKAEAPVDVEEKKEQEKKEMEKLVTKRE